LLTSIYQYIPLIKKGALNIFIWKQEIRFLGVVQPASSPDRVLKLDVHDWLKDVNNTANTEDLVEIRFKNTRKDYFVNVNKLQP
jgi:hypothetical protein